MARLDGPDILALDFDGVLCDGMREYFEASRRAYARTWPADGAPDEAVFPAFRALRPVIMSGWEMPLLLRAIVERRPEATIALEWERVRGELLESGPVRGEALVRALTEGLDAVRREWIGAAPDDWLGRHAPYCPLDDLRRLVAETERAVLVTTKEGEFARLILDRWGVRLADVQGKEAGTHKCENLRALIAAYTAGRGRAPRLWFVEDRLETLEHVTMHADLDDVGLYLAAWGYNTPATRAAARTDRRIRLLDLAQFAAGVGAWP